VRSRAHTGKRAVTPMTSTEALHVRFQMTRSSVPPRDLFRSVSSLSGRDRAAIRIVGANPRYWERLDDLARRRAIGDPGPITPADEFVRRYLKDSSG